MQPHPSLTSPPRSLSGLVCGNFFVSTNQKVTLSMQMEVKSLVSVQFLHILGRGKYLSDLASELST